MNMTQELMKAQQTAIGRIEAQLAGFGNEGLVTFLRTLAHAKEGRIGDVDINPFQKSLEEGPLARANAIARAFRNNPRGLKRFPSYAELAKGGALAKADLDVGTLTNFSQITGGQALGYVSLDTMMARGTVRPSSFTIYQCLPKSAANQVVDYWAYAAETGGQLPGAAFASYNSVSSGTLQTNAGIYDLKYITLQLALDGRAITTALAAQNSFVNVAEQENTNAALSVLGTINWACYWGNPTYYPNQFAGLDQTIPAANKVDFQAFSAANSAQGWTNEQTLFNLIYEQAAAITSYRNYGIVTHAFMSPSTAGALQTLTTTLLNNIVNGKDFTDHTGIIVNGDLQGMNTRFGDIHFPVDLFIDARDKPAQATVYDNGTTPATTTNPTKPVSVTVASGAAVSDSAWTSAYTASSGDYLYAVASMDSSMNESTLTYGTATGIPVSGTYTLTIAPPADASAAVFRIYRSGLGLTSVSGLSAQAAAELFRYIGEVAANGSSNVTFVDYNTHIPGSATVFLLDLEEGDAALDFRYLLPLSRINLFAQSLYMPWAVAMIGSIRNRIPKFHGQINNITFSNPTFNPLAPNL